MSSQGGQGRHPDNGRTGVTHRSSPGSESSLLSSASAEPALPFFSTTFSTHRVSSLYIGTQPLSRDRLETLTKRLRDVLVGDVVRGVEVGLDGQDTVMSRAGPLEAVDMGWRSLASILAVDTLAMDGLGSRPVSRDLGSDIGAAPDPSWGDDAATRRLRRLRSKALHISLRYESVLCTALLLPQLEEDGALDPEDEFTAQSDHFLALPLLLLRMPTPLKSVLVDFLSSTFDCRVSPLRLGTRTLITSLERWVAVEGRLTAGSALKDAVLTLAFSLPTVAGAHKNPDEALTADLGLRAVDVIIPAQQLQNFRLMGLKAEAPAAADPGLTKIASGWVEGPTRHGRVHGQLLEEGWQWRDGRHDGGADGSNDTELLDGRTAFCPFTEALGAFLDEHLGLNLFDPRVRVAKVACGGFVVSEGRLKLFASSEKDQGSVTEPRVLTEHLKTVLDSLGDLLERASARL